MNASDLIVTVTLNPAIDETLSIPRFAAGAVNRVATRQRVPGGKGVNVAANLADLGEQVAVTGFLGEANLDVFERMFVARRIENRFVRLPGETRVGIKIVDPATDVTTDINFPGLAPSVAAIDQLNMRVAALTVTGRWFVFSGSVPPGVDSSIYATLIAAIRSGGGRVLLDTSGAPLRLALPAGPEIVKPNVDELSELVGRPLNGVGDVIDAARSALLSAETRLAVVSMGGDGAAFVTADRAIVARPPAVKVVSTVGAGDALVAGLVAAQRRDLSLEETARLAVALGAHAVTKVGAGVESQAAIDALVAEVRVEAVELAKV